MNTHGKWAKYLQPLEGECGINRWDLISTRVDGNGGKGLQARVCVFA